MEIGKEESRTTERRGRNEICFLPYLCGRTLFSLSGCFSLAFSSWMLSFPSCQKETLTHQLHQRKTPVSLLPHCKGRTGTAILGYCSAPPWHRGYLGPSLPWEQLSLLSFSSVQRGLCLSEMGGGPMTSCYQKQSPVLICRTEDENEDGLKRLCKS